MNTPSNAFDSSLNSGTPPLPVVPTTSQEAEFESRLEEAQRLIGKAQELIVAANGHDHDHAGSMPRLHKLIIQIPCYNEAATLGITLEALPREIEGIDCVEWLIVDDGSADSTIDVAQEYGVDHIVRLPKNQGACQSVYGRH